MSKLLLEFWTCSICPFRGGEMLQKFSGRGFLCRQKDKHGQSAISVRQADDLRVAIRGINELAGTLHHANHSLTARGRSEWSFAGPRRIEGHGPFAFKISGVEHQGARVAGD